MTQEARSAAHTSGRCGINVWLNQQTVVPCARQPGHPGPHLSAPPRSSADEEADVLAMTPREALTEVEQYVRASAQKRAFGKTRVLAALRVLEDHLAD